MSKNVFHQAFLVADQALNVLLGGYADETLSARCFRLGRQARQAGAVDRWSRGEAFVNWLFVPQDMLIQHRTGFYPIARHCERAYQSEIDRRHLPPEYRP